MKHRRALKNGRGSTGGPMFKIKADPTFDCQIKITGQGREQVLNVTFRHKTRTEYSNILQEMADGKKTSADAIIEIVEKWDADMDIDATSVKMLEEHQPGADWAIITAYGEALTVARKGN